jgi:LysM repeat protein
MGYKQIRVANPNAKANPGWCLQLVTESFFGSAGGHNCARDAWDASGTKNTSRNMPNVDVPVFFSWVGTISGIRKDWGHTVVWVASRGRFLSSPGSWSAGYGQQWFNTIDEIVRWFNAPYLGFTLDIPMRGAVAEWVNDPTPAPTPTPEPAPSGKQRVIVPGDTLWQIAVEELGDGTRYMEIFNASNFRSGNPSLIFPGEIAIIP